MIFIACSFAGVDLVVAPSRGEKGRKRAEAGRVVHEQRASARNGWRGDRALRSAGAIRGAGARGESPVGLSIPSRF